MAITCQTIVQRARAMSELNDPLTNDRAEMLSRIRSDQHALFVKFGSEWGDRFQVSTYLTSGAGASGRTLNIGSLTPPLARVIALDLPDGRRCRQVDIRDQYARHAPRYYVQATTLTEVSNDWGASGAVTNAILYYVPGPTDIDPDGAYSQVISLEDQWADLLVLPLAMYLHQKDPGRDPAEYERLKLMLAEREEAYRRFLVTYGGDGFHSSPNPGVQS